MMNIMFSKQYLDTESKHNIKQVTIEVKILDDVQTVVLPKAALTHLKIFLENQEQMLSITWC